MSVQSVFDSLDYEAGNDRDYLSAIESMLDGADLTEVERQALETEADQVTTRIISSLKEA